MSTNRSNLPLPKANPQSKIESSSRYNPTPSSFQRRTPDCLQHISLQNRFPIHCKTDQDFLAQSTPPSRFQDQLHIRLMRKLM
ncbi:hypothetical protein L1887_23030 [Cichorium endivia]|nr:hypothetical protein L1887_23030 [Cichorium endivia]